MEKYNGWTNYATWRVNLEIFDGTTLEDMSWDEYEDAYELGQVMKDYVEEILCQDCDPSRLAHSYAMAFLNDVNWTEIANSMIEAYKAEVQS